MKVIVLIIQCLILAAVFISTGIGLYLKIIPQYQTPARGECVIGVGLIFLLAALSIFVS